MTLYDVGHAHLGIHELGAPGQDHPLIRFWHSLCPDGLDTPDEVPWCSSAMNGWAWLLREKGIPRTFSKRARSWLNVGMPVPLAEASIGWDVVVLWRGIADDGASGHVGLYAGRELMIEGGQHVYRDLLLAGNQANAVTIAPFDRDRVLGVRRLVFGIDFQADKVIPAGA